MIYFIAYNIVIYIIYSFIDFICVEFGIYKPLSLNTLLNTDISTISNDIYIVIFNILISSIIGYYLMKYIKNKFYLKKTNDK